VIAAIQQAIALKSRYNVRVINLSLGRPIYESYTLDPLCQEVEAAWKAGIVVVVAAGNDGRDNSMATDGYGTITAPGNDPYAITVGAMKTMGTPDRADDLIASYSSKGPTLIDHVVKPDIVSPGNRIDSMLAPTSHFAKTYPQNAVPMSYYEATPQTNSSNFYFTLSGTSMAAPVVSGAAADLLQAQPGLTPDQIKAKMMLTAYKIFPAFSSTVDPTTGIVYTSEYDIFTVGAGYLDIEALLADQSLPSGNALSPIAVYDTVSGNVDLSADPSAVWNSQSLWGNRAVWHTSGPDALRAVWGTTAIEASRAVWGTQAVWHTSTLSGFSVVWGTRAVWGTSSGDATESVTIAINGEN
jgi:serine protease AprX